MRLRAKLATVLPLILMLVGLTHGRRSETIKVVGDRVYHPKAPKEYLQTYVRLPKDHTSQTPPVAVGVELTGGFVSLADKLPMQQSVNIPLSPTTTFNYSAYEELATLFPRAGRNPFTFLYWSYGFNGHPPVGVYDVPHFDLHFMFPSTKYWWNEQFPPTNHGPCMGGNNATFFNTFKPIPASCWPGSTAGPITNVGDFVWAMGSHLMDFSGPEFNPPQQFNYTQIYGQYNGEVPYFEAMIASAVMERSRGFKECVTLKNNPLAAPVPRDFPGELCLERRAKSFMVEYRKFAPAVVGCSATDGQVAGYYPATAPVLPPSLCTTPVPPAA